MNRLLASLALAGMIVLLAVWQTWAAYTRFLETPLNLDGSEQVLLVEPGMSGRAVVARLAGMGVTRLDWRWRVYLRFEPTLMQAGEYRLEVGITPQGLLRKLARGDVIRYRFTIVEGWTVGQLLVAFSSDPVLGSTVPDAAPAGIVADLVPDYPNPEGWFLPETYTFVRGDAYGDVLRQAHAAMQRALAEAWAVRAQDHPVASPYELLILASIIEKETAIEEERGDVSGVFVRRLQRGMRLQTDPTVIYGLGDAFDGDIRRRDLQTDTPYNTYTRHGLPPTPIALPGRASLQAAAQPAAGDTLYFVADGSGGHTFSATLEEHQKAVNRMLGREP